MKLYYLPAACSLTCHIALAWINEDYEVENISANLKSDEYLKLNPQGCVPCLEDDGFFLTQNIAILKYLDDKYPQANLFASSDIREKADVMRWLAFCNSDLHKLFTPLFAPIKCSSVEKNYLDIQNKARENIIYLLKIVDMQLENRDYLVGKKSVSDAYLFVILNWCKTLQFDLSDFRNLANFYNLLSADEGVKKALAEEGL